jgi:hypothetical protein
VDSVGSAVLTVGGNRLSDLGFGQRGGWEEISEEVWSRRSEVWVRGAGRRLEV